MKTFSFVRFTIALVISCFITACASKPKVVEPTLGAAAVVPAKAPIKETAEIVETPRGPSLTLDNVLFDFEQSSLRSEAHDTVSKAVAYLNANPERNALVEGHTDHTGDEQYNHGLSLKRSESVRDALISQGISTTRIKTAGLGETSPIADNSSLAGRQTNRRVEIIFKVLE